MTEVDLEQRTLLRKRGEDDDALQRAGFLTLEGVTKQFGEREVVERTSLAFEQGEFVTVLGPSGCGKTTLLRMIGGFEPPTSGDIRFKGRSIVTVPPERRPFNLVFQSYALFPHLNVFDNVAYGLRAAGIEGKELNTKVFAALSLVGLEQVAGARVDELSGGMSQRVALVRALVRQPEVLLLDEPLGALDLQLRKRMQVELREIQHETGATFIYVTHDQEEALVMSKRIVIMQSGRVVQTGSPEDVYQLPRTRFAAEFIGTASFLPAKVVRVFEREAEVSVDGKMSALVRVPPERTLSIGQAGVIAVRPEDLRIGGSTGAVGLTGEVIDEIFLGQSTHVFVALGGLGKVRAQWTGSLDTVPKTGEGVRLDLIPSRAIFLVD
jgi:spermidine/putrescine transport system ATP-binding protein